jgi:FkbM family methyltransferase
LWYYASSIPDILTGFRNWPVFFTLLLGLPKRRPVTIELNETGLRYLVRTPLEAWVLKEAAIDRQYEVASLAIENGWSIVDIGAGIGEFTLDVARRCPDSRILAYEPNPESFSLLIRNLEGNQIENVEAFPYAIGSGSPGRTMLQPEAEPVTSSTSLDHGAAAVDVPQRSLKDVLATLGETGPEFLKIDCEGCEYDVVLGAERSVLDRFGAICLEFHEATTGRSHTELIRQLNDHGFRTTVSPSPVHPGLGLIGAIRTTPS